VHAGGQVETGGASPPAYPAGVTYPYADEVLALADGRRLAWAEWGDPRGTPVVFLHPCPGSRMLCPDPGVTTAAGVRLITVDRPGYGRSDPVAVPTLGGFAHDLERLLDHLWLGQIRLVGWGCGGQYAAACAAVLAERVGGLALVATPIPGDRYRWLPPFALNVAGVSPGARAAWLQQAGDAWVSLVDNRISVRPQVMMALAAMWAEAFSAGTNGWAADVVAGSHPWGFSASGVRARVTLFYGADDRVVDLRHGRWWARALPGATLVVRAASAHLVVLAAWADILRTVA
jgi:pimeloyl-ACP methyl ester carboxylesterase